MPMPDDRRALVDLLPQYLMRAMRGWDGLSPLLESAGLERPAFFLLRALVQERDKGESMTRAEMHQDLFNPYSTVRPILDALPVLVDRGLVAREGDRYTVTRVRRLLQLAGLAGCHRRKRIGTTRRAEHAAPAPDHVRRDFSAIAPNRLWVADITDVPTWAGFLYLAVVLDVYSRRVVGWAMANGRPLGSMRTELVRDAVAMAIMRRRPAAGCVHHSDQGSQYTSLTFGERLREAGIVASMGSRGDCFDNALMESFFATLECELLDGRAFPTHRAARTALFDYLEGFYNSQRRHSALGYCSPMEYERRWTICAQVA